MGSRIGSSYAKDFLVSVSSESPFPNRRHLDTHSKRGYYYMCRSVILSTLCFFFDSLGMARLGNICSKKCLDRIMKTCFVLAIVLVMYTNGYSKETAEYEAYNKHDDAANLTLDEEDEDDDFTNFMRPQQFTWGTLLGLLVASIVVVIGSFLVLWRLCCDVEMRVTREVMEPLKSISQAVSGGGSVSGHQALLGRRASTSVLEIA